MPLRNLALGAMLVPAACAGIERQPADPSTVAAIEAACTADGVFVRFGGRLVLSAADPTGIAAPLAAAGVDRVCADPARFASGISTATWVARNISAVLRNR